MTDEEVKMKRLLAALLILVLLAIGLSGGVFLVKTSWKQGLEGEAAEEAAEETDTLHNPVVVKDYTMQASQKATYDCVWFGSYPQSDATGKVKEPIKWRVLSVDESKAFLVADCNLDVCRYHDATINVFWKDSTIRKWLNNEFMNLAFTEEEKDALILTVVDNEDNENYGTESGDDTVDSVLLLSLTEVTNSKYGFSEDVLVFDEARERKNTAYVAAGGSMGSFSMNAEGENDYWWLRSPGNGTDFTAYVNESGYVSEAGHNIFTDKYAVAPAIYLKLSATDLYSYAGTVCTDGTVKEVEPE